MIFIALFLATCFLAYSNGANDNFNGVASLYGSRTSGYRTAISWATFATLAGSISSIFLAQSLLKKFSGKGLVPDQFVGSEYFVLAVALGAGLTVILATVLGFPISTPHALTGAIVGCGLMALGALIYFVLHALRIATGIKKEWCVCVGSEERVIAFPQPAAGLVITGTTAPITVAVDEQENCQERYAGSFLGVTSQQLMDAAHFLSAGVVSFARGLNDTPKIVALLLLCQALDIRWGFTAVAATMAVGG